MLMTVSPPGHEHIRRACEVAERGSAPDANVIAELRSRYDTHQLSR